MQEEGAWVRDRFLLLERELGGMFERQRGLESSSASLRVEVHAGFVKAERDLLAAMDRQERGLSASLEKINEQIVREGAHLRGEVRTIGDMAGASRQKAIETEAARKRETDLAHDQLVAKLQEQATSAARMNRWLIGAVIIATFLTRQILDALPTIMGFLQQMGGV